MQSVIIRQLNLTAHLVQFCRYLRDKDFDLGPNEESDILKAYQKAIPRSFEEQKSTLKALCVKNRKQYMLFDELFDTYWAELAKAEDGKKKEHLELSSKPQKSAQQKTSLQVLKDWLYGGRIDEEKEISSYSAFEAISNKDFSAFNSGEQKELLEIIKIIAKRMANKYSRRYHRTNSTKVLDLKNTIRKALRKGHEIETFVFKAQRKRKVNLILICDVSKSMELYSQFLIEFMYSFQQAVFQLKTFVFSTRLISLSQALSDGDFEKVLNNLSEQVPYWSGGTRIGESLYSFKQKYGSSLLNKDSVVMIMSDGWDTGEVELLEDAMKYIHKKADRVIWLNPLAGNPDYKPTAKGMAAAMPYIDVFTSAHSLDSLRAVSKVLTGRKKNV